MERPMLFKSELELELEYIDKLEQSLANTHMNSLQQHLKRFPIVQHLDVLLDIYFNSTSFDYILKEVLSYAIFTQVMISALPGGTSFESLDNAIYGKQLTTIGKVAIYITDPREPTSEPGQFLEPGM